MDDSNVSKSGEEKQDPSSQTEKSKQRAEELKAHFAKKKAQEAKSSKRRKRISDEETIEAEDAIVKELNRFLAIVHTSSTYVLIEKSETEFVLDSKASLLTLFENQVVHELWSPDSKKPPTKAQVWLRSPARRSFRNIVFDPRTVGHYDENFNIWKGFAVKPVAGDCSLFWEHVRVVICNGKQSHYLYVRKWLAHLFQRPWIIGTALILRGKQGTGKGTFVDAIGKLLGSHYAPLASLDQILGRFNAHLKNSILIFADEAIWGGNIKQVGILKSLITEKKLFIEGKGKDGYWIDNYKHLIVSSNEDWVVHLDPDDRRFFVLDVSDKHKEVRPYFDAILMQLNNGGHEALLHDLLQEDLTGFDPSIMPENFAGFDMKMESASSIDRFIYASLKEGCWDHADSGPTGEFRDLTIDGFYGKYKTWCEREHQTLLRKETVGQRLKKIIPGIEVKRTPREKNPARPNFYAFPSLEKSRASFESFYKQDSRIWDWS